MNNTKNVKISVAVALLLIAAGIVFWTLRSSPLPGAGQPAVVRFDDGTTLTTTWQEVHARAQAGKAYMDRTPSGGWMYQSDAGKWGKIVAQNASSQPHAE